MAFKLDSIQGIEKKRSFSLDTSFLQKELFVFNRPFSNKVKEDFYSEIGILLNAGINLKDALTLIKDTTKRKSSAKLIEHIEQDLVKGKSFSNAVKLQPSFTDYEYFSLKIGEETGTTSRIATQLGNFYKRKNEQRKHLINALTYPVIIISTAILVVLFMLQFVVPMFEDIFKQQQVELPGITVLVINISDFIKQNLYYLFAIIIIMWLLKKPLSKKYWYSKTKDLVLSKIPLLGDFIKTIYLSQFSQAMALLTASRIPLVQCLELVGKMIDYYPLKQALKQIESSLMNGVALSEAMSSHKLFDSKMIALIKVAEETNQTEQMFSKLNERYNDNVQQRSKMLSTVLEPFIILFVGLFVGFILIAMYLPMFKLSSIIG
jgi:type IV pilus assembly protein PilC